MNGQRVSEKMLNAAVSPGEMGIKAIPIILAYGGGYLKMETNPPMDSNPISGNRTKRIEIRISERVMSSQAYYSITHGDQNMRITQISMSEGMQKDNVACL